MRATMRDAMCPRYVCVNNIAFIYNNTTLAVLSNSVVRVVLTLTFRNVTLASFVSLVLISISVFSWQDGRKPIGWNAPKRKEDTLGSKTYLKFNSNIHWIDWIKELQAWPTHFYALYYFCDRRKKFPKLQKGSGRQKGSALAIGR